jgi:CheY-like chemotaxis protein
VQYKNDHTESGVHRISAPFLSNPGIVKPNSAAPLSRNGAPSQGIHGFVGKKTEDPQALKLLIAASEYATAAMCRLGQDSSGASSGEPHMFDRYVDTVFGLEVHFLFPNLSAEKRDLLVAIMKVRNSISSVLNGASFKSSARERAALGQLTADLQRKFLEFRTQIIESGLKEQLDPIQKKVFQDEFLSITLDKKGSTTLFFSTDPAPRPASVSGCEAREAVLKSDTSLRQPLRAEIPLCMPPLQAESFEPHVRMRGRSAQPVIDRDIVSHAPDVTAQPSVLTQLPEAAARVPVVTPPLDEVSAQLAAQRAEGRKTVLLISADSRAQVLIANTLRQAGHSLLLADAGFTGYALAMRERPDLVLVDLGLSLEVSGPDAYLDGRGVLKMLAKLPSGRALTFIGLLSEGATETEAQVLGLGAKACLQKPLDPDRLLGAVQNAWSDLPLETDKATRSSWTVSASV